MGTGTCQGEFLVCRDATLIDSLMILDGNLNATGNTGPGIGVSGEGCWDRHWFEFDDRQSDDYGRQRIGFQLLGQRWDWDCDSLGRSDLVHRASVDPERDGPGDDEPGVAGDGTVDGGGDRDWHWGRPDGIAADFGRERDGD
jgi:hypothetical protein